MGPLSKVYLLMSWLIRVNSRIQLEITQNHHSECMSAKLASEWVNAYLWDTLLYSLHLRKYNREQTV